MDSLKDEKGEDPDGIPVNLLIGCYVSGSSAGPTTATA
jgi:hypothetical protein